MRSSIRGFATRRAPKGVAGPSRSAVTFSQALRGGAARRLARLGATPGVAAGAILTAGFLVLGVAAPWAVWWDPLEQDLTLFLQPPSPARWFGTDDLGRDLLARVLVAARADLTLVVAGIGLAVAVAFPLGLLAGYFRGPLDRAVTACSGPASAASSRRWR